MTAPTPSSAASPPGSTLAERAYRGWRVLVAVVMGYRGEKLALRAGNLTFITITSLVPLAAVVLSIIHALNQKRIDALAMRFFEDVLSPGGRSQVQVFVKRLLDLSGPRAAGSLSFAVLLVSAGVLLRHLDASLNDLWDVRRSRPLAVSIALYAGVLLAMPLLLSLALLGTEGARQVVLWAQLPYSGTWFALGAVLVACLLFTSLYKIAPHAPVAWKSAIFGGFVAGTAWEAARHLYSTIAGAIFTANPVYGSLGIAPLFLFWIYVGWYIVLSGARLAYAIEHKDFHDEFAELLRHPRSQELIATRIAAHVALAFSTQAPPPTSKTLAAALKLPGQRIEDVLHLLQKGGLIIRAKTGQLHPASDPETLTLADISTAVGGTALTLQRERQSRSGRFEAVARYFLEVDEASVDRLKRTTWAALGRELEPELSKT